MPTITSIGKTRLTYFEVNKMSERKIAIVTGGTRGIGFAIATEFINNGCSVVITNAKSVE
jgi:NADP-dependent 3-hydroxy acid dehydrogenase YdfG